MYNNFFGLAKDPFIVNPDPQFIFSTAETDKTYTSLLEGVHSRHGLILLIGEVGTGKTLLLHKLIGQLRDEHTSIAYVFNPRMKAAEFLDYVLGDFGIEHKPGERDRTLQTLQDWLLQGHAAGNKHLLIIDEAQALSRPVFDLVHVFSSLEVNSEKLLPVVVAGQPELIEILRQPELQPFCQRIALRLRTGPLSDAETLQYIAHRLSVAGGAVQTVFTPGATKAVSMISAGIPRLINLLCEQAMIRGYTDRRRPVGARTVVEIAQEFSLGDGASVEKIVAEEAGGARAPMPGGDRATTRIAEPLPAAPIASVTVSPGRSPATGAGALTGSLPQAPLAANGAGGDRMSVRPVAPARGMPPPAPAVAVGGSIPTAGTTGPGGLAARYPGETQGSAKGMEVEIAPGTESPTLTKPVAGNEARPFLNASSGPVPKQRRIPLWVSFVLTAAAFFSAGYFLPRSGAWMRTFRSRLAAWTTPSRPAEKPAESPELAPAPAIASGAPVQVPFNPGSPDAGRTPAQEPITGKSTSPPAPGQSIATGSSPAGRQAAPPDAGSVGKPAEVPPVPPRGAQNFSSGPVKPQPLTSAAAPPPPGLRATPTPQPAATIPHLATGRLTVTSNVPGAIVTVDGQKHPDWITPHSFNGLSPGPHTIQVAKEGYNTAQQSVTVAAGSESSMNATLTLPRGEIALSTNPPGAEVLIDGKSYGLAPVRAQVDAGQHTFLVRQTGREPVEGKFEVRDQALVERTIELPPAPPAPPELNVSLTTQPAGATIYVDGAPRSEKTPASFNLPAGHHTLILFAPGYRPVRREIDVPVAGTLAVSVALRGQ